MTKQKKFIARSFYFLLYHFIRSKYEHTEIIFIAHDLSVVKHISDRIGVMYNGELVEINKTDDILDNPSHHYTRELLRTILQPNPVGIENIERELLGLK